MRFVLTIILGGVPQYYGTYPSLEACQDAGQAYLMRNYHKYKFGLGYSCDPAPRRN